jgi:hypothetical protein
MSNTNETRLNLLAMKTFAVIVEGDVAFTMQYPIEAENAIAALSSNPQIVEVPEVIKNEVKGGWTFDGTNFVQPEEQI